MKNTENTKFSSRIPSHSVIFIEKLQFSGQTDSCSPHFIEKNTDFKENNKFSSQTAYSLKTWFSMENFNFGKNHENIKFSN